MRNIIIMIIGFVFYFTCIGCATVVEKTGQVLDGSAFAEKKIAVYRTAKEPGSKEPGSKEPWSKKNPSGMEIRVTRNKANDRFVILSLQQFPAMKIRCTAPDKNGSLNLLSLEYLGGNAQGWNEYVLDLAGQGTLLFTETNAVLSIPHGIEPIQISRGRIRRYDTRITGTDALSNLHNRRERIIALAEWMNSIEKAPAVISRKEFEKHWKPILFPELTAKKKRPAGWQQENDQFVKAEDIRWNTSFTERTFPQELRPIRNSGTMLRDWEEALEWLYIEYEWDRILEHLSQETVLTHVK
ncbi:MAG: hypothetical protein FWH41_01870 [Treponema sp.]|nr:hypothetical protein [Treponema sp.]